ncbi:hypothetical protein PQX77_002757 [Marasmius sp. AFHP31]|nr:hypothetical protein PQX77_002757 [Marasmius sp. AFHP31]
MKMRQQLKELEYQRNSRAPICRLPVEIVGKIFTLTTSRINSWDWDYPKLPKVMHVCHLWRTVAAGIPSVWTWPNFGCPEMAREMMKYSGSVALSLEWNSVRAEFQQRKHFALLFQVLEQLSRVSSLKLLGISSHHITNLLVKTVGPAPTLHSIELKPSGVNRLFGLPDNFYLPQRHRMQ